jgi:hypothetical protein
LGDLHKTGDITLYGWALILKDKAGKISVRQAPEEVSAPLGAALELLRDKRLEVLKGPAGPQILPAWVAPRAEETVHGRRSMRQKGRNSQQRARRLRATISVFASWARGYPVTSGETGEPTTGER